MLEKAIHYSIEAEGISEQKKTFSINYRQELYAARQNRTVLQKTATAIEEHEFRKEMVPCLIVFFGHIKGIMPLPLSGFTNRNQLRKMIGQQIAFKVVQIHRDSDRVILDRVQALKLMENITWKKLKEGQIRTVVVHQVQSKAAYVDLGGITVELLASEYSWGFENNLRNHLKVGQNIDVKIMKVDRDRKEIKISARELLPNPWIDCVNRYVNGGEYVATVSGVMKYGIFCTLEPGLDALAQPLKIPYGLKVGNQIIIRVYKINPEKEQIKAKILRVISSKEVEA